MSVMTAPLPTIDDGVSAAGSSASDGCRVCVENCPYGAIDVRSQPDGTQVRIDPELCQRCGACSGMCPTSAIERPFLPDAELTTGVLAAAAGGGGPVVAVTCPESAVDVAATVGADHVVVVPSLLVINETHLLAAVVGGARAVLLVGCSDCTYGQAHLLRGPLSVTRALLGESERVAYIDREQRDRFAVVVAAAARLPRRAVLGAVDRVELETAASRRDVCGCCFRC